MKESTITTHEEPQQEEAYSNQSFKTHKRSRIKNKYRNQRCPCGSDKKFKKCCIGKVF